MSMCPASFTSYRATFSEIFGRFPHADGLIVDIRYNLGGNLHNHLLTLLSGKAYLTFSRPAAAGPAEPRDRWTNSAVVMNASSYSDGSVFPHAYREFKLGSTSAFWYSVPSRSRIGSCASP